MSEKTEEKDQLLKETTAESNNNNQSSGNSIYKTSTLKTYNSNENRPSFLKRHISNDTEVTFEFIYEDYMSQIEAKTRLKRKYIYAAIILTLISFTIGRLERLFANLLTLVYPLIWSIQEYHSDDEDFLKMWGSYWGVFGFFFALDCFKSKVLTVMPLYFFLRTVILMYFYLPCFEGARTFYNIVFDEKLKLAQFFKEGSDEKDSMLNEIKSKIKNKKE